MNSKAVSPVIGVMLMLVATVVIAAVVTSYSGGLASEEAKAPQATFDVSFSQTNGLVIAHRGGDTLSCRDIRIRLEYTEVWGGWNGLGGEISNANITHAGTGRSFSEGGSFAPGDVAIVPVDKLPQDAVAGNFANSSNSLGITNPANVGKTLRVLIFDEISGKPIVKKVIPIQR